MVWVVWSAYLGLVNSSFEKVGGTLTDQEKEALLIRLLEKGWLQGV